MPDDEWCGCDAVYFCPPHRFLMSAFWVQLGASMVVVGGLLSLYANVEWFALSAFFGGFYVPGWWMNLTDDFRSLSKELLHD